MQEEEEEETADPVTPRQQLLFEILSDPILLTPRNLNVSSWRQPLNVSSLNSPPKSRSNCSPTSSSRIDITFLRSTYSIYYSLDSTGRCVLHPPPKMTLFDELFEFALLSFFDTGC